MSFIVGITTTRLFIKALEDGLIRIAGTTENPYYSINNAILSRIRSIL